MKTSAAHLWASWAGATAGPQPFRHPAAAAGRHSPAATLQHSGIAKSAACLQALEEPGRQAWHIVCQADMKCMYDPQCKRCTSACCSQGCNNMCCLSPMDRAVLHVTGSWRGRTWGMSRSTSCSGAICGEKGDWLGPGDASSTGRSAPRPAHHDENLRSTAVFVTHLGRISGGDSPWAPSQWQAPQHEEPGRRRNMESQAS